MKWCNENETDVDDIFLIDQMASMQQHHFHESYATICKQDSIIRNKLNQVSPNKTVNKKAIYISRKHSFNSFEPAPSKKQKLASQKAPSPGSPSIPQKQEEECAKQQKQERQKTPLSSNMNLKVDAKPGKKNIPKDRLHETKKDTNQGESDKFDGNNLYFSSQAGTPHNKMLLVSCNATICSLEIPHFHCSLCNEESFTTLYQLNALPTFKMSEKVNCDHCGIEYRKDSLRRHIKTKHQKEEPSCVCVCVDIENAIFMVPKNNKHEGYPLHIQKKIHSGTDPCLSCESDFCLSAFCFDFCLC